MAIANSTLANQASSKAFNFVTIPSYFSNAVPKHFSAYAPVILMDDECYDDDMGVSIGKCISLESLPNEEDAIEAARIACISTPHAIGYAVKGVDHE